MSDKIVVPDGMLEAARRVGTTGWDCGYLPRSLEAAIRWLSENPIVPKVSDALFLLQERVTSGHLSKEEYCAIPATTIRCVIAEWQRRMFVAPEPEKHRESKPEEPKIQFYGTDNPKDGPGKSYVWKSPEPEVSEEIKDLLLSRLGTNGSPQEASENLHRHNAAVLEAFRRGQKSVSR